MPRPGRFRMGTRRLNWGRPTVPPPPPPEDITDFAAGSPGITSVPLTWTASPTAGATTKIYQSSTPTPSFPADYTLVATKSAGVESHTATGLTADTTYYWVAVPNTVEGGDGDPTGPVSATTLEEGSQTLAVFPDDFTFLGARVVGSNEYDGQALTIRTESSDATQPKHLLALAHAGSPYGIYEFRVPTTWDSVPGTYNPNSYASAALPVIKNYTRTPYAATQGTDGATPGAGSFFLDSATADFQSWMVGMSCTIVPQGGSVNISPTLTNVAEWISSTRIRVNHSPSPSGAGSGALFVVDAAGAQDLDGAFTIGVDPSDNETIVWIHNTGYTGEGYAGWSTLDYASETGTFAGGPVSFDYGWKSTGSMVMWLPAELAAILGVDVVAGVGGYWSILGTGGTSMGPALYGLADLLSTAPGGVVTTVPLQSFTTGAVLTPGAGKGRGDRPEPDIGNVDPAWNDSPGVNTKWNWNDRSRAGVVIWTATKRAFISFGEFGRVQTGYVQGQIYTAYWGNYAASTDPLRFAPVSEDDPWTIQPDEIQLYECPVLNPDELTYNPSASGLAVTSITSDSGKTIQDVDGCVAVVPGHGVAGGGAIFIVEGADIPQYTQMFLFTPIDADSGYLNNTSVTAPWVGGTSSNPGITMSPVAGVQPERVRGAVFDPDTGILYQIVDKRWGATGTESKLLLLGWQLNG